MKRALRSGLLILTAASVLCGQAPQITGISNSASGAPVVQSGSWVSIYGTGLSATTRSWRASDIAGNVLPSTLDGVTVQINGKRAAIAYISPTQLNVQAPTDSVTGSVPVQVTNGAGMATSTVMLQAYSPGFFTFPGNFAAAVHNAGGVLAAPAGHFGSGTASRPAQPGEILQIYATGFGPTTPAVPAGQLVAGPAPLSNPNLLSVTIGGLAATVQYAGIVMAGVYQLNVVVPLVSDGDQPILATIGGVSSQAGTLVPVRAAAGSQVTVTVAPTSRTIRCGTALLFTATVANTSDRSVTWQVNGETGGSAEFGTISPGGLYNAPADLPASAAVIVTAISRFDPTAKGSVMLNLQNPLPVVQSVSPNPLNPGASTISVEGSGFAGGATIYLAGAALPTTRISGSRLTASTTVPMPAGRLAAVKVTNPNPGAATSPPIAVPVRPMSEKMPYSDAVRFLERTTWGPTPQAVVELQSAGREAWLAAQFAKPASRWPDPNNSTENASRLQTAFWNVALTGDDQLRQRAAFALAQILVVSAVESPQFQQMVAYQRLMGDHSFSKYRDLLMAVTLSAPMGDYLDMVNNDKANPTTGTVANENFARELIQLFTLGLMQLDPHGTPVTLNGSTVPEYDESVVAELAKVMTGWTYGPTPGFNSLWRNMPYYFGPMVSFEDHHDTTQKQIGLPDPCIIPAGGSAASDLNDAMDCILRQSNVAPFVAYRLIQRFVMSDPPPAYVGRVADAFRSSQGDLRTVITAVLTDNDAQIQGTGKLSEPILYVSGLLRSLNATVTNPASLTAQAAAMGQAPLAPASVFSYFLPDYRIPGLTPSPVAPEFQGVNAATALARANFAYRAATNGISAGIRVDLANWQDLANNPADLVEAINQALYRGEMDSQVRSVLEAAAGGSTNLLSRVRSALYAAAAAPQYQVKR